MFYLYIFEDGEIRYSKSLASNDKIAADDGVIDLIQVDDSGVTPKQYHNGEWVEVEKIPTSA